MHYYNDFVVRVSHSAWLWLMSAVFAFGSLYFVFLNINVPFENIVGAPMFDFQNDLTTEQVFAQLPGYDDQARLLYQAFLFIDFYFPFFAGLVMAAAGAFAWRHLAPHFYSTLRTRNLFAIFLVPTIFDWCENIFAVIVVWGYPEGPASLATMLVFCKKAKLATMLLLQAVVLLSLATAAIKWLGLRVGLIGR